MKKTLAMILSIVMCLSLLAACGGGSGNGGNSGKTPQEDPVENIYDTGEFQVVIPEGWLEAPVSDIFAEEDGALDSGALQIIKGGESSMDVFSKPYVDIRFYGPDVLGMAPDKDFYDDVEEIDDLELDNYTFEGFSCLSFGYEMTILFADDGDNQIQVVVYTDQEDGSISVTDDDVLQILESIVPSDGTGGSQTQDPGSSDGGVNLNYWEGQWYGWWSIKNAEGMFAEVDKYAWDVCANIVTFSDNSGYFEMWDTATSYQNVLASCDVIFREGEGKNGCMVSENGKFFECGQWLGLFDGVNTVYVDEGEWEVDPADSSVSHFDKMLELKGTYVDPENSENRFDYYVYLRPWGTEWDDVSIGDTEDCIYSDMMPVHYDDWYIPLLELDCEDMPESYEEGIALIEDVE